MARTNEHPPFSDEALDRMLEYYWPGRVVAFAARRGKWQAGHKVTKMGNGGVMASPIQPRSQHDEADIRGMLDQRYTPHLSDELDIHPGTDKLKRENTNIQIQKNILAIQPRTSTATDTRHNTQAHKTTEDFGSCLTTTTAKS